MKKKFFSLLFSAAALLALASPAFAVTATFDQKISVAGNVVATVKTSLKEKKIRTEATIQNVKNIIIRNDKGIFNYLPDQNFAIKIPELSSQQDPFDDLSHFMKYLERNKAKKTGSETLDGKDCDIYEYDNPANKSTTKVWVWKEKEFPIRLETKTGAKPQPTLVEFSNIQFDAKIDDSVFELPSNVKAISPEQLQAPSEAVAQQ